METERQSYKDRATERKKQRETERQKQSDREAETKTETDTERDRHSLSEPREIVCD